MSNFYIGSFDSVNSTYQSESSSHPFSTVIGKGSNNTGSYAEWNILRGSGAQGRVYFRFDVSSIPKNATIDNVGCTLRASRQQGDISTFSTLRFKVVIGTDEPFDYEYAYDDESVNYYFLPPMNCTRAELNNIGLCIHSSRGYSSPDQDFWVRLYGATLTVNFTAVSGSQFLLKVNGLWIEGSELYKKVNGVWVLQEDLSDVFESGIKYK